MNDDSCDLVYFKNRFFFSLILDFDPLLKEHEEYLNVSKDYKNPTVNF